jgi:hypothetical protein
VLESSGTMSATGSSGCRVSHTLTEPGRGGWVLARRLSATRCRTVATACNNFWRPALVEPSCEVDVGGCRVEYLPVPQPSMTLTTEVCLLAWYTGCDRRSRSLWR